MQPSSIPLWGLLLLGLQLCSSYPVSTGLTDSDLDILKVRLQMLLKLSGAATQNRLS